MPRKEHQAQSHFRKEMKKDPEKHRRRHHYAPEPVVEKPTEEPKPQLETE